MMRTLSVRLRLLAASVIVAASAAVAAPPAHATDRVYWTNFGSTTIPFANLDGSGTGGNVNPGGAMVNAPAGVALDPATDTVYWANFGASTINFARLDGTGGGGTLKTAPITPDEPAGLALDAATGRIYWADFGDNKIEFANLDGSGGGALATTGTTPNLPEGVAVDDATGRIYWANCGGTAPTCAGTGTNANTIGFANLNGTGGGGTLVTTGVTLNKPVGVAVDAATGQIFWANSATTGTGANTIEFANLNDTGGAGTLNTFPVPVNDPQGVAVDPAAGKVYWANFGGPTIAVGNVNNSGANFVNTSGETLTFPVFPALLEVPVGSGAPTISGGTSAPTTLACSPGSWAGDRPEALLYDAPQSFSYNWTNNGAAISGATASTLAVTGGGNYACSVTAHNQAGATTQTSSVQSVAPVAQLGAVATSGTSATITIVCAGVAGQTCSGSIAGSTMERRRGGTILAVSARARKNHKPKKQKVVTTTVAVATASYTVGGGQSAAVHIALNQAGARALAQFYRLPVVLAFSGSTSQTDTITYSYPRLRPTVRDIWTWTNLPCSPCFTTVNSLTLTGLNSTEKVTVRCAGTGCSFSKRVSGRHGHQLSLAPLLAHARLSPGATVEVDVTAPNSVGFVRTFTMVAGALPKSADQCLPPGARNPTRCA